MHTATHQDSKAQAAIRFLHADQPSGSDLIGQKAAVLQQLARSGFPVPAGICVTTDVFKAMLAPVAEQIHALRKSGDLRNPATAHRVAQAIAALLHDLPFPATLRSTLAQALPTLGNGTLAVRSSATVEDLAGASFAGQYETVLGVKGEQEVENAILACWRSFFSANALAAQAIYGSTGNDEAMAVLIQPLLNADCSGVCFSVDPIRLRPDLLLLTTAWGLGTGVVTGSAPVDTIRLRRSDLGVEENFIADKHSAMMPNPAGGTQLDAVPVAQRQIACLPESWLRRLGQFALTIEQTLGQPQDIEWAIADQRVWILQSRPITTLPEDLRKATHFPIAWANAEERTRLWWLERRNDRPSAALLPAEVEFVNSSTRGGAAAVEYAGYAKTRWRKVVNGRVYMAVADSPVGPGDRRIRAAAWQDLYGRLHQQGLSLWDYWGPEIIRATDRLAAFDRKAADSSALAELLEDSLAASQRHWMIHTLLPRRGPFEQLLATYVQITGKPQTEAEEELPSLWQGAETVQTRLIEALYDLACLAIEKPQICAWLEEKTLDRRARLSEIAGAEEFAAQFEKILSIYGGRVTMLPVRGEAEIPVELLLPWREAPEHLPAMIALYLPSAKEGHNTGPRSARERALREFQSRVEGIANAATDAQLVEQFRQQLAYVRHSAAFLDEHNHYIDQLSEGQYHQALIDAGRWLTERGDLPHPYTTFWLYPTEIVSALRAAERQDFGAILAARKQEFEGWRVMVTPAYIGLPDPQLPERPPIEESFADTQTRPQFSSPNTLIGQVASTGQRAGRARIIAESTNLPDLAPGDVLVAINAGPRWTPIFPILAAIVLESGGVGDHSAITAREFGVPAVFGAVGATSRIPPDAWVTVDGVTGKVTWE